MKIYLVNIIWTDPQEMLENSVKVFSDKEKAKEYYEDSINNWLNNKKTYLREFVGASEEEIDAWDYQNLVEDINNNEYCRRYYVYDEGVEKLFEFTTHEVS